MAGVVLELPRSVVLALWLQEVGGQMTSDPEAVRHATAAVQHDDEPHTVHGLDDEQHLGATLVELVGTWAGEAWTAAAGLPVPGDPAGVPAVIGSAAATAGECVLVHSGAGTYAAIPRVEVFGSALEPGHTVQWEISRVADWRTALIGQVGTLTDAERDLRGALAQATRAITALDVARWRPEAATEIASLRGDSDPGWRLPPAVDARRARVLLSAARLRAIVALATADDGGALNLWQADQRSTALAEVDRAARRAMSAATLPPALLRGPEPYPPRTER